MSFVYKQRWWTCVFFKGPKCGWVYKQQTYNLLCDECQCWCRTWIHTPSEKCPCFLDQKQWLTKFPVTKTPCAHTHTCVTFNFVYELIFPTTSCLCVKIFYHIIHPLTCVFGWSIKIMDESHSFKQISWWLQQNAV